MAKPIKNNQDLIDLAIEIWRLEKRLGKATSSLNKDQNKAFQNSITKLKRYLDVNKISVKDYSNQKYNDGLNLDILSIEKDSKITENIIKETHEPAIFLNGKLIKKAKVIIYEKA
jgi:hypothetical protein